MLTLKRTYFDDKTTGVLTLPDGEELSTLELIDLNNVPFVSCIPEGRYIVKRNKTGRHQWYQLSRVPNRSFIEIHPATKTSHLQGCIGLPSAADCDKLIKWFGDHNWVLEITS